MLKFCYLFLLFLILSCGGNSSKNNKTDSESKVTGPETVGEEKVKASEGKVILFFGNSLTAGMGLETTEAFPALIQNRLDSLGLKYRVINAGLSGETTASGKNRLSWLLTQKIDVFVLELGANDGLRGIAIEETRKNLQAIIDDVKEANSATKIILAGMQIPPNMGQSYTTAFKNLFLELSEKNETYLIPFLLKDVGGIPELNQEDGIHPTAAGQHILANNVWEVLETVVE